MMLFEQKTIEKQNVFLMEMKTGLYASLARQAFDDRIRSDPFDVYSGQCFTCKATIHSLFYMCLCAYC